MLYEHTHRHAFGGGRERGADRVGLEVEVVAFVAGGVLDRESGCRRRRVLDAADVIAWLRAVGARHRWDLSRAGDAAPVFVLPGHGIITLEPGAQIEYSGDPRESAVAALDDADDVLGLLEREAEEAGFELRALGFNNECDVEEIGLQIDTPRYRAMDEHFATIGPYGRMMMRATCSLQINLDFGTGAVAAERWRLANMIAPAMNALFASSPHVHDGQLYHSFRHEIWRHADPARTGRLFDRPDLDPVADYLRFALDATVIPFRAGAVGRVGRPLTFREWMDGSRELGYPDLDDWAIHLTTLFPDVRARGFMEFRSIDALPSQPRSEAVLLVTRLLYDSTLRRRALALLESRERVLIAGDHEHGGFWRSDRATGRELAQMALGAHE
jgi:glutamate--cysteine ligase